MKFSSAAHLTGGGTITGDLTIDGDLTVNGDSAGAYSEIITGVLQISGTGLNDAPINLLSRDDTVGTANEGVRIRFGTSADGFLADYGYRYRDASDFGASITSTNNLRLALAGQDEANFLFKGGNSTTGASIDIRTINTELKKNEYIINTEKSDIFSLGITLLRLFLSIDENEI